jgi:hypothetical protein
VQRLKLDRIKNVIHTRSMYLPGGEVGDDLRGNVRRNRFGNFLGDVDIELLERLGANATCVIVPEFGYESPGAFTLGASGRVVRIGARRPRRLRCWCNYLPS